MPSTITPLISSWEEHRNTICKLNDDYAKHFDVDIPGKATALAKMALKFDCNSTTHVHLVLVYKCNLRNRQVITETLSVWFPVWKRERDRAGYLI